MSIQTTAPAVLTVAILKTLKFSLSIHVNGGDKYSQRVETNEEWGLAVSTETNGSPQYIITSKTLYMTARPEVSMNMKQRPWDLEAFVASYNQARQAN